MLRLISALVAVAVAAAARPALAEDCRLNQLASLPAAYGSRGPVILDAEIDGHPGRLMLDTGADVSFLNRGFVDRFHLPQRITGDFSYGLTRKGLDTVVDVDRLKLGRLAISAAVLGVANFDGDGTDGRSIGTFGAGYLAKFDIELDPTAGKVNFFSRDHCPGKVVYWAREYFRLPLRLDYGMHLLTDVTVDGKTLRAVIDTGSPDGLMRLATATKLFGITATDAASLPAGSGPAKVMGLEGSPLPAFQHVFQSLTFGDITLHDTKITIADVNTAPSREHSGARVVPEAQQYDILIGMSLLRRLHLFIAYSEPAIYFTLADPPAASR